MAELTENLKYKEYKYLFQLYLSNPLGRLIKSFKRKKYADTASLVSILKRRSVELNSLDRKSKFNVLLKTNRDNMSLCQWFYKYDHKTFLWVLFSNVSNFLIINSLVN